MDSHRLLDKLRNLLPDYDIIEKLGNGSFGEVYKVRRKTDGFYFAAKIEKSENDITLLNESNILSKMVNYTGFTRVIDFVREKTNCVMVLDLLGPSLQTLFKKCGNRFSLNTVYKLGIQMIGLIQNLHENLIIHRDIKPDNFMMGTGKKRYYVHLIDFGLGKFYKDDKGNHLIKKKKRGITGTLRYASLNCHKGHELSRRDDLESLGYTLIYFLKGNLPWQNIKCLTNAEKYVKVKSIKENVGLMQLCAGLPKVFFSYFEYIRNLNFQEKPAYGILMDLFKTELKKSSSEDPHMYVK